MTCFLIIQKEKLPAPNLTNADLAEKQPCFVIKSVVADSIGYIVVRHLTKGNDK